MAEDDPRVEITPIRGFARRLFADTGHATFDRVLSLAVWTLLVPSLLRGPGPGGFALWSLLFALAGAALGHRPPRGGLTLPWPAPILLRFACWARMLRAMGGTLEGAATTDADRSRQVR